MAIHRKLSKSYQEAVADVAQLALATARSLQTATNGTISVSNGDGTTTVIGVGAGMDETGASNGTAYFVGDTTPPSAPTGVTFTALDGSITGIWDGTLEDGVPADFDRVVFRADGSQFGTVNTAGSASSDAFEVGSTYSCDAVAVDVQGNVSDPCDAVEVTVRDLSAEAEALAEEAAELAEEAAELAEEVRTVAEAAQEAADAAQADATAAAAAASELASAITDAQGTMSELSATVSTLGSEIDALVADIEANYVSGAYLEENYYTKTETDTEISTALTTELYDSDGNAVYATTSELSQTSDEILATVAANYVDTDTAASYATTSYVDQTASSITSTVAATYATQASLADYVTDSELADELAGYVTDSALSTTLESYSTVEQTADAITSAVTEALYTTDEDGNSTAIYATTSSVTQTADEILSTVAATYVTADDAASTYATQTSLSQTATSLTASITAAAETADEALGLATTVEASLEGFEVTVSETYATQADLDAVKEAAEDAQADATEALEKYATLSVTVDGVSATASSAYTTANTALTNAATAQATADAITTKVTEEYTTTADLEDMLDDYVTDSTLSSTLEDYSTTEQTAEMIASEVSSALYTTDSDGNTTAIYATTSEVKQTADEILSTVAANYVDNETGATYATTSYVDQQDDAIELAVASTYATQSALADVEDKADEANDTAESAYSAATALYGTCATAASTAAKVVTCSDFVLFDGASIAVTFTYANTAGAITLNVNGTGALSVYVSGGTASTSNYILWSAGTTVEFVYDGTYWLYAGGATSYKVTCGTAAATFAKTATQAGAVVCRGTNAVVTWTYGNSYSTGAITFNLGSTAAKSIYYGNKVTSSNNPLEINATETLELVFSGAYWYVADSASLTRNATLAVTVDEIEASVSEVYDTTGYTLAEIADLAITAEGITSTVSSTYVSLTDLSTTLEEYSTTDQTAEAITSAVTSALYTTDDDGNSTAIYATTSEVEQTATDITTTFTSSTGSNLLTDPGFESTAYGGTLPSGFAYSTTSPHSGDYCMACTGTGTRYYFNHAYGDATDPVAITVEPGETYLYSMYYKKSSSSTAWSSSNMKMRIATADGNDTLIAAHSTGSIGTDWTQITGTWTNSAGYTEVYVMVATSVTSGTVYVDDAYFGPYTASGTLIRESSDGVEVAKYSGSSYSTTRTLMAADGFHVQDSGGIDLTVVDSDGMTVYANGSTAAEFTADSVVLGANFSRPLYITASDTMTLIHPSLSDGFAGLQIGQEDSTPTSYLSASQDSGQGLFSAAAFDSIISASVLAKAAGDLGDGYASVSCSVTTAGPEVTIISDEFSASVNDVYFYVDNFTVSGSRAVVNNDSIGFKHTHSDSGYSCSMGVGSGGYNRGLYDDTKGRWIAYADSDGETLLQDADGIRLVSGAMFPIGVAATASSSSATIGLNIYLEGAQNYGYVPVLVCSGRVCAFVLFAGTNATSSFSSVSSSNYTILASGTYMSAISFITDSSYDDCVRLKFTFSQTSSSASGAVVYSLRPNVIRVAKVAWTSS